MSRVIGVEIVGDSASVERAFSRSSAAAKSFDTSLGKSVRGAAAGTGVFRGLGRSLAFASGTFLGFAAVSDVIRGAIDGAENLKKAQDGLVVAIDHTGGNLKKLIPEYTAVAEGAAKFGVNQADATTALERATVLTGNAAKAQHAYQEALVISKATGKDFNDVLTATAKGQDGVTTSLQRYGIEIKKGTPGLQQFETVMARFGGQAKANTSAADVLNATWQNTEEIIGTALLPTLDKYLTEFGRWLEKMQRSGQLQKDVNSDLTKAGHVLHVVGDAIHAVDTVTGSFTRTLEILLGLRLFTYLKSVASGWDAVAVSAGRAAAAEGAAGSIGIAGGVAGSAGLGAARIALIKQYTGEATKASLATRVLTNNLTQLGLIAAAPIIVRVDERLIGKERSAAGVAGRAGRSIFDAIGTIAAPGFTDSHLIDDIFGGIFGGGSKSKPLKVYIDPALAHPGELHLPGILGGGRLFGAAGSRGVLSGPFGSAQPIPVFKSFSLTIPEQIAQAQASLTKGAADDVAAAKQVIARIKRLIDQGHLAGKSLIQALQAEAAAVSTVQSAEAAAVQKRAQEAAAAKARIQAQIQNSIDPIKLEVALSKAQALGQPLVPYLKALKDAAEKAIASGKLTLAEQKQAYDQIASLNQQIASATQTALQAFVAPANLQLTIAKDQALGLNDTKALEKLRRAILKFIATHKKNIQAEIDAYNQLAQVNQQLGITGRPRSLKHPPKGAVGAYGYEINPKTDQPIHVHTHIDIDGKRVADNTTRHQQRHRRRNPSQRRGPNAGMAY